ncbi:MAG: hypothetical protein ACR2HA_07055 [Nocardioides sp.]
MACSILTSYVRQSTGSQLERNRESTDRQYALVDRAVELGWGRESVTVIDEDLGVGRSSTPERAGFARLTAEVSLWSLGQLAPWPRNTARMVLARMTASSEGDQFST